MLTLSGSPCPHSTVQYWEQVFTCSLKMLWVHKQGMVTEPINPSSQGTVNCECRTNMTRFHCVFLKQSPYHASLSP